MTNVRTVLVPLCLATWLAGAAGLVGDEGSRAADEAVLRAVGVPTDGAALLDFLRRRLPSADDQERLAELIRKLDSDNFQTREQATADLVAAGPKALPFLRRAINGATLELTRRAQTCIARIDQGSSPDVIAAAVRLLKERKPAGAAAVLLDFLPQVAQDDLEQEVFLALLVVGVRDGKADTCLSVALKDGNAARRAAAASVLGRSADAAQRALVRPLLNDKDAKVRFHAAVGLLKGKEKEALPSLIPLLVDASADLAWEVENLLCLIAGDRAPKAPLGNASDQERKTSRDAWEKWWAESGQQVDLAKIDLEQRDLGLTLFVTSNSERGRVAEMAADGTIRWEIKDLQGPLDAHVVGGQRVLIAEYGNCAYVGGRVTERDFQGKVLWEYRGEPCPVACQRLRNGNTLIATWWCKTQEVSRDGKAVWSVDRRPDWLELHPGMPSMQRMRNGNIAFLGGHGALTEMDDKGKKLKTTNVQWQGHSVEVLPGGNILIPRRDMGCVVELDSAGKKVWEHTIAQPTSATRLPNGNTLISCGDGRLVEVSRAKKVVWEQTVKGYAVRVRRR